MANFPSLEPAAGEGFTRRGAATGSPDFVARVRPFSVLRFMDWARANETSLMHWAERPRAEHARWTSSQGVPLEVMLALADAADADPWLTIPHTADDDLVERMALLALADLDPARSLYVELSNEVWNAVMPQHNDALGRARALWPDASADDFTLRLNWYGMRSAQVCSIWKRVFGSQSERVQCVLGGQSVNTYSARQALDCPLWDQAPCSAHGIDAIAIAPYFGGHIGATSVRDEVLEWTRQSDSGLGALFTELTEGGVLSNSPGVGSVEALVGQVAAYRALVKARGLDLVAYEGGQHVGQETSTKYEALMRAIGTTAP